MKNRAKKDVNRQAKRRAIPHWLDLDVTTEPDTTPYETTDRLRSIFAGRPLSEEPSYD